MKGLKGKVGGHELEWLAPPRGAVGSGQVRVAGRVVDVSWRRDSDGIELTFYEGVRGFDFEGEAADDGRTVHTVFERGGLGEWREVTFLRAGEEGAQAGRAGSKKAVRVRAQMPGKILKMLVKAGAAVEKGQPLLVMEAMKMENEIRAAQGGKVREVRVTEGQAVETGADLLLIDP